MFEADGGHKAGPVSGAGMPAWQAGCREEEEAGGRCPGSPRQAGRQGGVQQSSGIARLSGAGIWTDCSPGIRLEQGGSGGHRAIRGWGRRKKQVSAPVIQSLCRTHRCSLQLPFVPTGTFTSPQSVSLGPCLIPASCNHSSGGIWALVQCWGGSQDLSFSRFCV